MLGETIILLWISGLSSRTQKSMGEWGFWREAFGVDGSFKDGLYAAVIKMCHQRQWFSFLITIYPLSSTPPSLYSFKYSIGLCFLFFFFFFFFFSFFFPNNQFSIYTNICWNIWCFFPTFWLNTVHARTTTGVCWTIANSIVFWIIWLKMFSLLFNQFMSCFFFVCLFVPTTVLTIQKILFLFLFYISKGVHVSLSSMRTIVQKCLGFILLVFDKQLIIKLRTVI